MCDGETDCISGNDEENCGAPKPGGNMHRNMEGLDFLFLIRSIYLCLITATRIHLQRSLYLNEVGNVVHFAYEQHMDRRRSVAHQSTYAHPAWCRR